MELFFHDELHRHLATIVQREQALRAQRRTPVPVADRAQDGSPAAARRTVGNMVVRADGRLRRTTSDPRGRRSAGTESRGSIG